jgi:FkbM family methyltransferase
MIVPIHSTQFKIALVVTTLVIIIVLFTQFGGVNKFDDDDVGPVVTRNKESNTNTNNNDKYKPRGRQVFLDFGANTGDSIRSFALGEKSFQGGHALLGRGGKDSGKWDIWGFEPNPAFNDKLQTLERDLRASKLANGESQYNVRIMRESVANTVGGVVDFYLDTVNPDKNFWGSSLKENHPDVVKSKKAKIQVNSYDVAKLIMENYTKDDFIIVKMDIEGSEYDLLPHFFRVGVLNYIDEFACEWHKYMEPADAKGVTRYLKWMMKEAGVKLLQWD